MVSQPSFSVRLPNAKDSARILIKIVAFCCWIRSVLVLSYDGVNIVSVVSFWGRNWLLLLLLSSPFRDTRNFHFHALRYVFTFRHLYIHIFFVCCFMRKHHRHLMGLCVCNVLGGNSYVSRRVLKQKETQKPEMSHYVFLVSQIIAPRTIKINGRTFLFLALCSTIGKLKAVRYPPNTE